MPNATPTHPNLVPTMRYRDAPRAVEWLCKAFGFERHMVVEGAPGIIEHAQLTLGNGMIMLGSVRDDKFGSVQKSPLDLAGANTQSVYVIVPDADAHHTRAVAQGAQVVYALKTEDYGGRGYSCLDLEGHLWHFGTYDPWAAHG